jgi:mannose-6-phosphate isomerase-like protein (cupin superfamily)
VTDRRPVFRRPGEGRPLPCPSGRLAALADAADTVGAYELSLAELPAGGASAAEVRPDAEAFFVVLEGRADFTLGDGPAGRLVPAPAGTAVHVGRGVPHRFANPGPGPARVLCGSAPAGAPASGAAASGAAGFPPADEVGVAGPADGPAYSVVGDRYRFLADGARTGGSYALFEFWVPPDHAPPPHVHGREEEAFFVLEGELTFYAAGARISAGAGSFLNAPRDVPHRFRNEGAAPARALCLVAPAGLDRFFAEIGRPLASPTAAPVEPTKADIDTLLSAAPRYGLTILPPGTAV